MMSSKLSKRAAILPTAVALGLAFLLVAIMATSSKFNAHPDESNHLSAAIYYRDNFLPPEIGDPAVRDSYSVWGVSYLNYHWAEYFFAGKFILLTSPLIGDERLAARFFNVALFGLLAVFFAGKMRSLGGCLAFAAALLVSPQVWYVFSYSNNDAFAFFIAMLLAHQTVVEDSLFRRVINSPRTINVAIGSIIFGSLFGLLAVCKPNYWIFLLFVGAWLAIVAPIDRKHLRSYAIAGVAALAVISFRIGLDIHVNGETNFAGASYINYFFGGFESSGSRLMAYQEEIAELEFKPSTMEKDLAASRTEVKLRAKGVPALEMILKWRWHTFSFWSLVGGYGYMTIWAGAVYYAAMFAVYAAFLLYCIFRIARRGRNKAKMQLALTISGFAATAMISFYLSWNYAFQPQGRYLFPIFPMIAMLVYANRGVLARPVTYGMFFAAFVLSLYSFVFVALARIDR